jgi:hypothetical protein
MSDDLVMCCFKDCKETANYVRPFGNFCAFHLPPTGWYPTPDTAAPHAGLIAEIEGIAQSLMVDGYRALPCSTCARVSTISIHWLHDLLCRCQDALQPTDRT